jgi:hypothetical protein
MGVLEETQILLLYRWPDRNTGTGKTEIQLADGTEFDVIIEYFKTDEVWHIELRPKAFEEFNPPDNLWMGLTYGKHPDFAVFGRFKRSDNLDVLSYRFAGENIRPLREAYGEATIGIFEFSAKDFFANSMRS